MQCRNALRQHVASATITPLRTSCDHIWISDELLDDAFARYLRISHTARRYGSNVPGPLEARRRQSKRRIGFIAAEHNQGVPLTDFGALFGSGQNVPGTFSWQPPSKQIAEPQKDHQNNASAQRSNALWGLSVFGGRRRAVEAVKEEMVIEQIDPVATSRMAFEKLLNESITSLELGPVLAFLESDKDEPSAKNFEVLIHWLKGKPISKAMFERVRDTLLSKHQLRTISTEALPDLIFELCLIAKWYQQGWEQQSDWKEVYSDAVSKISDHLSAQIEANPSEKSQLHGAYRQLFRAIKPRPGFQFSSEALRALGILVRQRDHIDNASPLVAMAIVSILNNLVTTHFRSDHWRVLTRLLVHVLQKSREENLVRNVTNLFTSQDGNSLSPATLRKRLVFWLDCVHESGLMSSQGQITKDWTGNWSIYHTVGHRFTPTDLTSHLSKLSRVDLATALLVGWGGQTSATLRLRRERSALQSSKPVSLDRYQHAFLQELRTTNLPALQDPLLSLMLFAERREHDAQDLLRYILSVLDNGAVGLDNRLAFYETVQENPPLTISHDIQEDMINRLMNGRRIPQAFRVFLNSPLVPFKAVARLPQLLINHRIDPRSLFDCIIEHNKKEKLKGAKRERFLAQNVIHLVQQLAWAISQSHLFSQREAFEAVWRCYRFLQDRDIRMDATISRAAFHAGVVRALRKDGGPVSLPDQRLNFIMKLVRWYEGDEVADRLQTMALLTRRAVSPSFSQVKGYLDAPFEYDRTWRLKLPPRF